MGEVFLARQRSLERPVAIKFLTISPGGGPAEQVKRFRREAELMAKILHPNIVTVFDYGDVDGRPFLVMEYVEGRDLRHYMKANHPFGVHRVPALVVPLAEALDVLHEHGVLHRDFKPENILIGPGFTPKVSDFGIAVEDGVAGSATATGHWMGTIGYVAPEQQYRLKVDARADQYSMAAVMYELLTGKKALGVFKPPSRFNREFNPRIDDVLMRGMREDPEDRFPSILEFGSALNSALATRPVRRVPTGLVQGIAALALLLLVIFGLWSRSNEIPTWSNHLGMPFVQIPAGEFSMGSTEADPLAKRAERPAHRVEITRPFSMCVHEVTVREFRAFIEESGYKTEAEANGLGGYTYDAGTKDVVRARENLWMKPSGDLPARDDDPVSQVTWTDAVKFCEWLSRKEKLPYRLPTEAEWEYACRAGSRGRWCSGDDPARLGNFAWTGLNAAVPQPVARKRPNAFGLFDMHGNVWEWCHDYYGPYDDGTAVDPAGLPRGHERVVRGGACDSKDVTQTRSAARLDSRPDYAYFTYGFRVCVDLPAQPSHSTATR